MAKIKGPLHSAEAHGTYGQLIQFQRSGGRQIARRNFTPANPRSIAQVSDRNPHAVAVAGVKWTNRTAWLRDDETETDKAIIIANTPRSTTWNLMLQAAILGNAGANYDAAEIAWALLDGAERDAWDAAASALVPEIVPVQQQTGGGIYGAASTPGQVFFHLQWGLFALSLLPDAPGAVPTDYGPPPLPWAPYGVNFGGAGATLQRSAAYDGGVAVTQLIASMWLRNLSGSTNQAIFCMGKAGTQTFLIIYVGAIGKIVVQFWANDGGFSIWNCNVPPPASDWFNLMLSFKANGASPLVSILVDEAEGAAPSFLGAPNNCDFSATDNTMGNWSPSIGTDQPFHGDIAEFWCAPGAWLDISDEANRRKFIDEDGAPVDLGSAGQLPTGTAPLLYIHGPAVEFGENKGTGGDMAQVGTFTDSSTNP